jgi:hypothetical protein
MRNNVWSFLPLILYGIAVLLGLYLCYFVAPQNKRKRWIYPQGGHRWIHRIIQPECQIIRLDKYRVHPRRGTYQ